MLSRQEEDQLRRETLRNDLKLRQQQEQGSTFAQFAQADANIDRGRFTAHERSTVIGSTPTPDYPAGPAWCADPGAQLLEPPLSYYDPALEPSVLAVAQAPDPTSADAHSDDVQRTDVGSLSSGDPAGVSFASPPGTSRNVYAGSLPRPHRRY
jgi:hypothetical protein